MHECKVAVVEQQIVLNNFDALDTPRILPFSLHLDFVMRRKPQGTTLRLETAVNQRLRPQSVE